MNVANNDIVVFGDNYNDIDMLEKVGVGVVVKNAKPKVKDVADCIIGTNEEDSVIKYIEENISLYKLKE